jgi:hypothetical protein
LAARATGWEGSHPATSAARREVRRRRFMMRGGWMIANGRFRVRRPGWEGCRETGNPLEILRERRTLETNSRTGRSCVYSVAGARRPCMGANPGSPRTLLAS